MNTIWTKEDDERWRHTIMRLERMHAAFAGATLGYPEIFQTYAQMRESGLLDVSNDLSKYKEDIDWLRELPTRFIREPRYRIDANGELIDSAKS